MYELDRPMKHATRTFALISIALASVSARRSASSSIFRYAPTFRSSGRPPFHRTPFFSYSW